MYMRVDSLPIDVGHGVHEPYQSYGTSQLLQEVRVLRATVPSLSRRLPPGTGSILILTPEARYWSVHPCTDRPTEDFKKTVLATASGG